MSIASLPIQAGENAEWSLTPSLEVSVEKIMAPCMLLASLSMCIGCYNIEMTSKEGLKVQEEQLEIHVVTKDSVQYKFLPENYRIQGDTLSGLGVRTRDASSDIVFDARLPLGDLTSIETREFNITRTIVTLIGIGGVSFVIVKLLFPH